MAKNILITGGCGFIGSNIVARLLEEGHNVTVLDDLSSGKKENIKDSLTKTNCKFVKGSILEQDLLMNLLRDVEVVIHEAANPDVRTSTDNLFRDFEINVQGTLNVLQAMVKNKVTKIIFSSSGGTVYGETNNLPTPEHEPLAPISHYGASKAACEQYLSSFSSLYSIEAYSLRLGNIYGPPSDHGVMYDFYWKLKKDPTTLEILGDGKQIKSYLYVDDCVDAHIQALQTTITGHKPLNIASTEGTTVTEIANEVIKAMTLSDVTLTYTGGKRGWAGDVRKAVVDISQAKKAMGWEPKTTISEGVKKYITWLKK